MNPISSFWAGSKADRPSDASATATESQTVPATGDLVEQNTGQAPVDDAPQSRSNGSGTMLCPDPSAHHSSPNSKLSASGASAGLYKTDPNKNTATSPTYPLDKDGKLSSAGEISQLNPENVYVYPVLGIDRQSAAGAAASLGFANQKSFEHWKPDPSSHAGKAALLAHDYKMKPVWQPELSAAGSKAAILAHKGGPNLNLWEPEASKEGNSAAGIALRNRELSPTLDYGYTADGRKNALVAATGAVGRSRSGSTPTPVKQSYPDAHNAPYNALNAATIAHKPSTKSTPEDANLIDSNAMQSARITHYGANVSREMFTEHPPVEPEVEEKKKNDALRGASLSMAKQMYAMQQQAIEEAAAGDDGYDAGQAAASLAGNRQSMASTHTLDIKQQAMQYIHLQETAQKLAADRLAKLDAEDHGAYRRHFGFHVEPQRSRLSIRNRNSARRASSEGKRPSTASDDDELRSRRIRHQMSEFQDQVKQVDAKKRQKDRENLLAAAERSVQSRLHAMDERVFAETGKVSPAMLEEWEAKARAKAAKESESRMQNRGLIDVGGGKLLEQSEIDRIAAERVQPTLDEVNHEAEQHRARDEEMRLDAEEKKRHAQVEKDRDRETKAEQKRAKDEEKRASKAKKEEEKQAAKAEKQAKKDEKRKSKEIKRGTDPATATAVEVEQVAAGTGTDQPHTAQGEEGDEAEEDEDAEPPTQATPTLAPAPETQQSTTANDMSTSEPVDEPATQKAEKAPIPPVTVPARSEKPAETSPTSPTSPTKSSGLKSLFSKLHRKSKSTSEPGRITITHPHTYGGTSAAADTAVTEEGSAPRTSSSLAPRSSITTTTNEPKTSYESSAAHAPPSVSARDSVSEVAAGGENPRHSTAEESSAVSDLSAEFEEARDGFNEAAAPVLHFASAGKKSGEGASVGRETRFREEV
ncbi:MAG: hypothetical protein Q9157_001512 [Trypethelium eluteriae]